MVADIIDWLSLPLWNGPRYQRNPVPKSKRNTAARRIAQGATDMIELGERRGRAATG